MKHLLSSALAVLMVVAVGSMSAANDFKVMPGSACWWNPSYERIAPVSGASVAPPFFYDNTGALTTNTAGLGGVDDYIYTVCGLVRDYTTNLNGLVDLRVNVFDGNPNGDVHCAAWSMAADGTTGYGVGSVGSGTAFAGGYKQLVFGAPIQLNQSWNGGTYELDCAISPGTRLVSVYYVEQSGGDSN